ncbi:MAG: M28 family peptidase [Planctomycetota bacterium]|nr:M28 family peptidase [Planctomycetota bacterium]MDA1139363.1 M28 family peptidase [Planctomycetota bacterium]
MNQTEFIELLTKFLLTHSPSGQEEEMDDIVLPMMQESCKDVFQDEAGNIVGTIKGTSDAPAVILMAHKDEIGTIVKRVNADGRLSIERLGGSYPWRYGEGPMDVLTEDGPVTGFLSVGSSHVSAESKIVDDAKTSKALDWTMVHLDMKLSKDEVLAKGIRAGSRAVISRSRKQPTIVGNYLGAWSIDDKGGVAVLISVMKTLSRNPPKQDVKFVISSGEEVGVTGGTFAARTVEGDVLIALEVAPVAEEYDIRNTEQPVILYKDGHSFYHKPTSDQLFKLGGELGFGCQAAVVSSFGSDASFSHRQGLTGKPVCLCFPADNTHGYEVSHMGVFANICKLLVAYVT